MTAYSQRLSTANAGTNVQSIIGNSLTRMPICRKNECTILRNYRVFQFALSQYCVFYLRLSYIRVFAIALSCFCPRDVAAKNMTQLNGR